MGEWIYQNVDLDELIPNMYIKNMLWLQLMDQKSKKLKLI